LNDPGHDILSFTVGTSVEVADIVSSAYNRYGYGWQLTMSFH
jgi:hypothetical protein